MVFDSLAGSARYLLAAPDGIRHFQEARTFFEIGLAAPCGASTPPKPICATCASAGCQPAIARRSCQRSSSTDVAFHYVLAVMPRNPIYTTIHSAIAEWLVEQRHVTLTYPGAERGRRTRPTRRSTKRSPRAIPTAAERVMRDHLEQVADLYWE